MANKGRPKGDLYSKYVTAFNRAKKSIKRTMYEGSILSKQEFYDNIQGYSNKSDKEIIKDVMDRHKYGRVSRELIGRKDFYETELKKHNPKLKWSDIKYMSHEDFVQTYGQQISDTYNSFINDGWSVSDTKQLISQYIFGSE